MIEKTNDKKFSIWFGADVSKDTFDASVCIPEKELTEIFFMPKKCFQMTKEGVMEFKNWAIDQIAKYNFDKNTCFGLAMEATGSYSIKLVALILELFSQCSSSIVDPKSVKAYGRSLRIRNKTDKLDAAVIAKYAAERNPSPHIPQDIKYSHLRELVRQRKSLVNILTMVKLQDQEPSQVKAVISARKDVIKGLEKAIAKIELSIKQHVSQSSELKEQVAILASIPGVALITAATIIGELGDVHRFSSSKKVAAYAGVSPRRYESGTSIKGKTRMCKEGQGRIRQALYMSALASIRGDNGFARFYEMLVIKGKTRMAALGAVMRKMICVMRRLITDKSLYNDAVLSPVNAN